MKILFALMTAIVVSGCTTTPFVLEGEPKYDPNLHARLRVRNTLTVYFGDACEMSILGMGRQVTTRAPYMMIPAGSVFHKNKLLGMPVPVTGTPERFHEIVIDGNKPLSLSGIKGESLGGQGYTCGPVNGKFLPQPGKDYDVSFYMASGAKGGNSRCVLEVEEIVPQAGKFVTVPVKLSPLETMSPFSSNPKCDAPVGASQ
jgi:hypothetical protein